MRRGNKLFINQKKRSHSFFSEKGVSLTDQELISSYRSRKYQNYETIGYQMLYSKSWRRGMCLTYKER